MGCWEDPRASQFGPIDRSEGGIGSGSGNEHNQIRPHLDVETTLTPPDWWGFSFIDGADESWSRRDVSEIATEIATAASMEIGSGGRCLWPICML